MTRRNWTIFAAMMIAALFLVGCGSDGDTGMMGPAGPPGEAPSEEEIAEIVEEAVEEHAPEAPDTSEIDDAIAALEAAVDALENPAADPTTPEILGGMKDDASKADLAEMADDARGDFGGTFLKGGDVDLSSASDRGTLTFSNGLTVDGVTLVGFTIDETQKVEETVAHILAATDAVVRAPGTTDADPAVFGYNCPGRGWHRNPRHPDHYAEPQRQHRGGHHEGFQRRGG